VRRQAGARSEEDDNTLSDQGDSENVTVISKTEIIRAPVGGLASLPCTLSVAVTPESNFAVVWLKNDVTIGIDGTILEFDDPTDLRKRINFGAGPITIEDLRPEDSGNYTCRVTESSFVTHVLDVQVKPNNVTISPSGSHLIAKKGEHVQVTCSASGNPTPEIKWYDKTEALVRDGPVLDIPAIEHKTAGRYACHAINSLGKEVRHVTITLKHKPDVKARKEWVSAALGGNADLVCDIHHSRGETPRVEWLKNDARVSDMGRQSLHEEKEHNTKATLRLVQLQQDDFAKYTCRAENDIGSSEATITVTDTPAPAHLVTAPSVNKNNVTLTWSVESSSPLDDIELRYKKDQAKEWENLKLSVNSAVGQDTMFFIKHTLSGLEGKHHAVLLTKNSRGWSPASNNIVFNSSEYFVHTYSASVRYFTIN